MRADAQAQPNIALIKYWGKRDVERNLPAVSSLSVTLDSLWTRMSVSFSPDLQADELHVNQTQSADMLPRVSQCLDRVAGRNRQRASVKSECNFPIAAGLASSASAFAALVVAADKAAGVGRDALALARLAAQTSGSAARSLFGGFVELEAEASDIEVRSIADADAWPLEVVVAVTATGQKPLGSGEAMIRSAKTSPFYSSWLERQAADIGIARDAVVARDFEKLAAVSEHNCLKMHSVMWASRPPIVYWSSATLSAMQTVRQLQQGGHAVFFTIDAGPQLKAICLPSEGEVVRSALEATDGVLQTMTSGLGRGAALVVNR
ncbi:MAG: diphosphomevalonate decarboxylase [Woeseiaceae bacterium]|nr:diphosphomevalonate decarboxylase [Woeseiaceae bacterium]